MADQNQAGWEQQLREAARHAEEDLRRVIAFLNDEVVPEVRQNGSQALRAASRQLEKLAQRMDDRKAAGPGGTSEPSQRPGPPKV